MNLKRFLKKEFGISSNDVLPISNILVEDFLKRIEQRGTEQNIINRMKILQQEYDFTDSHARMYLSGVAQRILNDRQEGP